MMQKQITKHHVIPRSRLKQFNLKSGRRENKIKKPYAAHKLWHTCFDLMTPQEVICLLGELKQRVNGQGITPEILAKLAKDMKENSLKSSWRRYFPFWRLQQLARYIGHLQELFGTTCPDKIMEIVRTDWTANGSGETGIDV